MWNWKDAHLPLDQRAPLCRQNPVSAPSLNLLSQTLKEWERESKEDLNWICVCSDSSVAQAGKDEWVVNASDLGIPVTNDADTIGEFLRRSPDGVVFSTYQSSPLVVDALKDPSVPQFDLAIADEAHRCAGKVSSAFASILDSDLIRAQKRLFMTATPRVMTPALRQKASAENLQVASMDDTAVFGKVLYQLKFSQAIERELLCDYQVVVVGVDDPSVQAEIESKSVVASLGGDTLDSQTLAHHIALSKAVKDYNLKKLITFHSGIRGARDFCADHKKILESLSQKTDSLQIGFVHGGMPTAKRTETINSLRTADENQIGIVTNARCLSEGVDVPSLDGVAFIDPRSSVVDIIQAVGRAIRKSKDKSHGFIILPVYLGGLEDDESEILKSRFADIWKVILALKSQDDALSASLDQIRIDAGKNQPQSLSSLLPQKVALDLPVGISTDFRDALSAKLVSSTTDSWNEHYGRLLKFREEHGHALVPYYFPVLGRWCHKQRQAHKGGTLSAERLSLLEEVGFIWDALDAKWSAFLSEFVEYRKKTGKIMLPESGTLTRWASRQRRLRRKGALSQERIDLLNRFDFPWDPLDAFWMEGYRKCAEQISQGNRFPTTDTSVGRWMGQQRSEYKYGRLPQKYIDLLNQIGFVWDINEETWERQFLAYQEYVLQNGHSSPRHSHPLGSWVNQQRNRKKAGRISQERIDRLNAVGFVWNQREFEWSQKFRYTQDFVEEHGEIPPWGDPVVGQWLSVNRSAYRNGTLSQERIDLFEGFPGWDWNPSKNK